MSPKPPKKKYHPWSELTAKLDPARRDRIKKNVARTLEQIELQQYINLMRKGCGVTQVDLAQRMGVSQPAVSDFERQTDTQISVLRRYVHALGGELDIIARLPGDHIVRLGQFDQADEHDPA